MTSETVAKGDLASLLYRVSQVEAQLLDQLNATTACDERLEASSKAMQGRLTTLEGSDKQRQETLDRLNQQVSEWAPKVEKDKEEREIAIRWLKEAIGGQQLAGLGEPTNALAASTNTTDMASTAKEGVLQAPLRPVERIGVLEKSSKDHERRLAHLETGVLVMPDNAMSMQANTSTTSTSQVVPATPTHYDYTTQSDVNRFSICGSQRLHTFTFSLGDKVRSDIGQLFFPLIWSP